MSATEHELHPVPPPDGDAESQVPVVRVLKYGRVEIATDREFELDDELTVSFKDTRDRFAAAKVSVYVSEISNRSMKREGHPPWIKRLFVLKRSSS